MGEQWVAELNSEPIIRGVSVLEFYSFFIPTWSRQKYTQFTSGVEDQQDLER